MTGAILGLLKQGRLSLFGMLILLWGLTKELIREEATHLDAPSSMHVSPVIFLGLLAALLSIKGDMRQIIRSYEAQRSAIRAIQLYERLKRKRKEREMKRLEWTVNYVNNSKTPRSTKVAQSRSVDCS